jgi:acetate kinase
MGKPVVVLSCGSSSIQFALFDGATEPLPRKPLWAGQLHGIGTDLATLRLGNARPVVLELGTAASYEVALRHVRVVVERETGGHPPAVLAHRVTHPVSKYVAPVRVNAAVLADLKIWLPLAPPHRAWTLRAMELLLEQVPELPQVACFGTAFHEPWNEEWIAASHALSIVRPRPQSFSQAFI